jgi:hypothetical protein
LTVNFDTLDVTGELHFSEVALCLITNGRISDNGITGGVSTSNISATLNETTDDAVDRVFLGTDTSLSSGSYEGTANIDGEIIDFVGVFTGIKSAPLKRPTQRSDLHGKCAADGPTTFRRVF